MRSDGRLNGAFTDRPGTAAKMYAESYSDAPPAESENDVRSFRSVPLRFRLYCCVCSGPLADWNAFLALSAPSRNVKSMLPRIGPSPGWVEMSTNVCPALWFSAPNIALEKRIERICDFGGSLPPRNPSTRIVAARAGHLLQDLLHLVRIVGQRFDLILLEHVAETFALRIRRGGCRVAPDRDAFSHLLDRQRHLAAVVAPAHAGGRDRPGLQTPETDRHRLTAHRGR